MPVRSESRYLVCTKFIHSVTVSTTGGKLQDPLAAEHPIFSIALPTTGKWGDYFKYILLMPLTWTQYFTIPSQWRHRQVFWRYKISFPEMYDIDLNGRSQKPCLIRLRCKFRLPPHFYYISFVCLYTNKYNFHSCVCILISTINYVLFTFTIYKFFFVHFYILH